jgi:hypothetical protein
MKCPAVDQTTRDNAQQGIDALKQGWGDTKSMPPEAQKATNDACAQANDALRQGADAMGCPL